jgi:hypothetical protein
MRSTIRLAILGSLVAVTTLSAQVDYTRAERLLSWHTARLISGDSVRPRWYPDGNRFWYRNKTATAAEFDTVDPVRNLRGLPFDNRAHSLNEPYVVRRRWDYFVEHLLGLKPPENYEIVRPTDPWATGNPTP